MAVNLDRDDLYPDDQVPDQDVEICLKVIRTVRNLALTPPTFDAGLAVLLSHAHAALYKAVQRCQAEPPAVETKEPI